MSFPAFSIALCMYKPSRHEPTNVRHSSTNVKHSQSSWPQTLPRSHPGSPAKRAGSITTMHSCLKTKRNLSCSSRQMHRACMHAHARRAVSPPTPPLLPQPDEPAPPCAPSPSARRGARRLRGHPRSGHAVRGRPASRRSGRALTHATNHHVVQRIALPMVSWKSGRDQLRIAPAYLRTRRPPARPSGDRFAKGGVRQKKKNRNTRIEDEVPACEGRLTGSVMASGRGARLHTPRAAVCTSSLDTAVAFRERTGSSGECRGKKKKNLCVPRPPRAPHHSTHSRCIQGKDREQRSVQV